MKVHLSLEPRAGHAGSAKRNPFSLPLRPAKGQSCALRVLSLKLEDTFASQLPTPRNARHQSSQRRPQSLSCALEKLFYQTKPFLCSKPKKKNDLLVAKRTHFKP